MSRIAKMPIDVPASVDVAVGSGKISVKGPKGELRMQVHPSVAVSHEDDVVMCRLGMEWLARSLKPALPDHLSRT